MATRIHLTLLGLICAKVIFCQNPKHLWADATRAHSLPLSGEMVIDYQSYESEDTLELKACKVFFERNKKFKLERFCLEPNQEEALFFLGNEFLYVFKHKKTKGHIPTDSPNLPETEPLSRLMYEPFFKHDAFFATLPDAVYEYLGKQNVASVTCDAIKIIQFFSQEQLKVEKTVLIEQNSKMVWAYEVRLTSQNYQKTEKTTVMKMELSKPIKAYFDLSAFQDFKDLDMEFGLQTGDQAPDLTLTSPQGVKVRVSDFLGRVLVLDFWYFSCAPCRISTPFLDELYQKHKNKGFEILGINAQDKDKALLEEFRQKFNVSYRLLEGSPKSLRLYQVNSFPTFVVLDKKGKIAMKLDGYSKANMKFLQQVVEELISE